MRAVVQRILQAEVEINGEIKGRCERGLLVYLSVATEDSEEDTQFIAEKLVNLRIFEDESGRMNRSVLDISGGILLISNFTLHGDCRKGRRPSFDAAAKPETAQELYEKVRELIAERNIMVQTGVFGEHMNVSSTNDGPVTFLLDSSRLF
ncbi:D-aminoacyl-tRNA deacylase [Planctomycetota bacterium]